jgi:hypothetical protein
MKKILAIILLIASFTFAQTKDVIEIDDTTAINNQLLELQKQYEEGGKIIDNAQKAIDDTRTKRHQLEGAAWVLLNQKKNLLDTKYKKK